MQPTIPYRRPDDPAPSRPEASSEPIPYTLGEPTTQLAQPLTDAEVVAENHANDSSTLAPSRADQPRIAARSFTLYALALLTFAALAVIIYVATRGQHVQNGEVRGPGDEAAPGANADYKRR